jgi:flagellar protein FlaG
MSLDVASVAPSSFSVADDISSSARRSRPAAPMRDTGPVAEVPSRPPPEVLEAMGAASRAYKALREQGRELHFAQDADTGRMTIEVLDLDGNLLRRIPPSRLLDLATGGRLD